MARAAGCYTVKGVEITAKTIKRFMVENGIDYFNAAGQVMIIRDEIWCDDERKAFKEAYEELYGVV